MEHLEIQNLNLKFYEKDKEKKIFKEKVLFSDFNMRIGKGELVVILGDSGSGKTSLLNFISGFIPPSTISGKLKYSKFSSDTYHNISGELLIDGIRYTEKFPHERPIGLVMQHFSLYEHMTVKKNLLFPLKMMKFQKNTWEEKINSIAEELDIDNILNRKPTTLSGGEKQRVALGKMFLKAPLIGLFDEAFSNLDIKLKESFREKYLVKYLDERKNSFSMIFVSHDYLDAINADQIYLFKKETTNDHLIHTVISNYNQSENRTAFENFLNGNNLKLKLLTARESEFTL